MKLLSSGITAISKRFWSWFNPRHFKWKESLNLTRVAFEKFWSSNNNGTGLGATEFNRFINQTFNQPGTDLVSGELSDFKPEPHGFLDNVASHEARDFALKIHKLWFDLSRKVDESVAKNPDEHTLLPLPYTVVVPGARFREVYYWDTYWIVRGLLVSKLHDTAKALLGNLIYLADTFGFVPNGARSYYRNRSQPPLLSQAVRDVYKATKDKAFVKKAYPALLKEHSFWCSQPHRVQIRDKKGKEHVLTRYYAMWDTPRPESYTKDVEVAKGLDPKKQAELYNHIATTAETAWDFSSRWMADRYNLSTLKTTYILPVDLNAFLLQMEHNLAYFGKLLGKHDVARYFGHVARKRRHAMDAIFWNEEKDQYFDYWLVNRNDNAAMDKMNYKNLTIVYDFKKENQNEDAFPSNFVPLWVNMLKPKEKKIAKLVSAFNSSGLMMKAGVATSLLNTGQQWDFPNAWAPLQHMMIEGLANTQTDEGISMAKKLSQSWLETNYEGFLQSGQMFEKYDVRACGQTGHGGEYTTQAGFGWTNGVVLSLFDKFGWPEDLNLKCPKSS